NAKAESAVVATAIALPASAATSCGLAADTGVSSARSRRGVATNRVMWSSRMSASSSSRRVVAALLPDEPTLFDAAEFGRRAVVEKLASARDNDEVVPR